MLINLAGQLKIEYSQLAILQLQSCQCPHLIPPGQALQQEPLIMLIIGCMDLTKKLLLKVVWQIHNNY